MNWYEMDDEERKRVVRRLVKVEGFSSGMIATELQAKTRNVVVGWIWRNMRGILSPSPAKVADSRARERSGRITYGKRKPKVLKQQRLAPAHKEIPTERSGKYDYWAPKETLKWFEKDMKSCGYIEGDPKSQPIEELMCCGRPVTGDGVWCRYHQDIVYGFKPMSKKKFVAFDPLARLTRRA